MEFGIKNIIFIVITFITFTILDKNVSKLFTYLKLAKPINRFDNVWDRIKQTLFVAIFQTKILRDKKAGPIHAGIFWGFLILMFSALNSILTGFGLINFFDILGPIFSVITILTDIFCFAIITAVLFALYRRYISKVARLQVEHEKVEAAMILLIIFSIVSGLVLENSAAITLGKDAEWAVRPFSAVIANLIPLSSAMFLHELGFWIHIILIYIFMNILPFSKHLHVFTSVPNVYFSNTTFPNALEPINFEDENNEKYGVQDVEDFTWKTVLDAYTCTHCGRCTSVCPANQTGKVLDPRQIMVNIRDRVMDRMPILAKIEDDPNYKITDEEQAIMDKKFIGEYQDVEALWQCTSCGACMQECPVNIEHVPAIMDMRRSLVLMDAEFPALLQNSFGNMETNATPWAFSPSERADWADGLEVKIAAENPEFDVLFWVGCAGSFDDRAKKISVAFSKLMNEAGINFAILGTEEQCTGDSARRAGNEYLADMLVKQNIETMNQYKFTKIVATCPHCFNTLKNEFPLFGAKYEVVHHTQFIMELIKGGKLSLSKHGETIENLTYHDSCYVGRYNDIYEEPRNILGSIPSFKLNEVQRSKDRGFCCGAGGSQMFMEETEGKRVNIERTEELLSNNPQTIAVNCPFCMTMVTDGVKAKEKENVVVKDIAEIVLENLA